MHIPRRSTKFPKYMQSNSMLKEANTQINHIFKYTEFLNIFMVTGLYVMFRRPHQSDCRISCRLEKRFVNLFKMNKYCTEQKSVLSSFFKYLKQNSLNYIPILYLS